jgi:23S rRNA (adenine1618-N6)-methyltransferase
LNYIIWLQDLLDTTSEKYLDRYDTQRSVVGLDIGTGASAIYPLLGCTLRHQWRFFATDIDEKSLQYAQKNISLNNLENRIKLFSHSSSDKFLAIPGSPKLDFTMCNPPFYESRDDLIKSAESKSRRPFSSCTGAEIEMVSAGGEVAFTERVITDSLDLKEGVQWYTTMLGKHSSVATVIEILKSHQIDNYAVTEFVQGSKTRRWGLAWSYGDLRPRMVSVLRHSTADG